MPIFFIALLSISAFAISLVGAYFSVSGLAKLFAGAPIAVIFMAGSLEFAKLVVAAFLHRAWHRVSLVMKVYLTSSVVVLVLITSMGIFGYLSHAYQVTSERLKKIELQITMYDTQVRDMQQEIQRLQTVVASIPDNRVTKRLEAQKEIEPRINELSQKIFSVKTERGTLQMEKLSIQTEIGPLIYVSQAMNLDTDQVAKWLILLFVSVFDPLAVCLVLATSTAIKIRKEGLEAELASTQPHLTEVKSAPTDSTGDRQNVA